jgi:type II protein arginine methyltransferase
MIALARQLAAAGDRGYAIELAARALALAPGDGEMRTLAQELLSEGVLGWHFAIVRDQLRNEAYDAALRRAVVPGCKVLEIGTGTGLLAMMAARAGADVVTCEANPAVAAAAREVIAANGLSDRIRVIARHSTALGEADLGGRADILVSEIVSNDLLSEGVLPAHRDAVARLLKPGAQVIPARGTIRVALAEDMRPGRYRALGDVAGFDLSPFNPLAAPSREIAVRDAHLALRSAAADLFAFDFASGPWDERRTEVTLAAEGGRADGIVQWIALDMGGGPTYENRPGRDPSCWAALFWPLAAPIETHPGQPVRIAARHEQDRVRLWRAEAPSR